LYSKTHLFSSFKNNPFIFTYSGNSSGKLTCYHKNPLKIAFGDGIFALKLHVFLRSSQVLRRPV